MTGSAAVTAPPEAPAYCSNSSNSHSRPPAAYSEGERDAAQFQQGKLFKTSAI